MSVWKSEHVPPFFLCVCVCVCVRVCSWYVSSCFLFFSCSCILYLCKNPVGSKVYFAYLQFQEKARQSSWSTQTSWCATARSKVITDTSAVWCSTPSRQHFCSVSLLNMYCVQLVLCSVSLISIYCVQLLLVSSVYIVFSSSPQYVLCSFSLLNMYCVELVSSVCIVFS